MKATGQEESKNWDNIMSGFRKKDERSYKLIFDQLYGQSVYFCYTYVKETEIAEEIVSDSFLKLFDRSDNFEQLPQVKSFLYTTIKFASLNYLSNKKTYKKVKASYQQLLNEGDNNTIDFEIFHTEIISSIMIELQKVAPLARKVFTLRYFKNLEPRKVSEVTGLTYQTVKNQTRIAKSFLKESSFLWKKFSDL